jgi:glycosyltransferase involved in cell wall biosynthesis
MRNRSLRILWVNCRLLHPLTGGDRIRTYQMLRELKRRHRITYLGMRAPGDPQEAVTRAAEFCDEIIPVVHPRAAQGSLRIYAGALRNSFTGRIPYFVERYSSREAVRRIRELCATGRFDLIVCDYLVSMIHLLALRSEISIPIVLFQHNVESLLWKRRLNCARNRIARSIYARQWQLTTAFEDTCARLVQGQIVVSEDERRYFAEGRGMTNVLGAVPTGVDFEYYLPSQAPEPAEPLTMAFLGSMDWYANEDAVQYFARDIFPIIKNTLPAARFLIIGRNPPASIRRLSSADGSIEVTGTVPDVRPHLRGASLMVLPLRIGGGTRIKLFEAMAMGLPVVSTTIGAEGLPVLDGEHLLLADVPQAFAERVCALLQDEERRCRMGDTARAWIRSRFDWSASAEAFERYCFQVLENPHP